jgi:hypothetical protein
MSLHTHRHPVHLVFTRAQAQAAFAAARCRDVESGGIYDARSAAIIIWSEPWSLPGQEHVSETVGTIYLAWHTPDAGHATVTLLEVDRGWTRGEVERHVTLLFGTPVTVL